MSSSAVVRVEGLGKRYLVPGSGTAQPLSGSPAAIWLKRRVPSLRSDNERDWFWALSDVEFTLERGEVLGIIGRNGAGKSTLLKLLAGIITPTAGRASLTGRVGSLLEIGTGFHPDLSGRDNVMLAAALLGVSRREVQRQFDDIVDYAGIGSFIDVPVKRYSSGMYMRLAYSVTALLRSDILLLDEVLAVGDAEFQKKTKRNVDSIAHDGRTVLFVSHSMSSVKGLCTRCIWLEKGRIIRQGSADEITDQYLRTLVKHNDGPDNLPGDIAHAAPRVDVTRQHGYYSVVRQLPVISWVETLNGSGTPTRLFQTGQPLRIRIGFSQRSRRCDYFAISFHTMDDRRLTVAFSFDDDLVSVPEKGVVECLIPELRLVSGDYALIVEAGATVDGAAEPIDSVSDATQIRVSLEDYLGYPGLQRNQGYIAQRSHWSHKILPPEDVSERADSRPDSV